MQVLDPGCYLGNTRGNAYANGIRMAVTRYTAEDLPNCALHAHVNPHLTLLLRGATLETRAGRCYERLAGQTVFFYGDEPHQNSQTLVGSQNLNVEFDPRFFEQLNLRPADLHAAVQQPAGASAQLLKAYKEFLVNDQFSADSIFMTLLTAFDQGARGRREPVAPWLGTVEELLRDRWDQPVTLQELSAATGRHPVTISRQFHRYAGCTLGEYMRRLKVERALTLIHQPGTSLTEVAYACGFTDQSHFGRSFRELTGFRPHEYKKGFF